MLEIFNQALSVSSEERADLVEHACGGNHELLADVHRLLATVEANPEILNDRSNGTFSGTEKEGQKPDARTPGQFLGRDLPFEFEGYTLLEFLGNGGMGTVLKARDSLNRCVAIKLYPHIDPADSKARERILQEGQILASLTHDNIGRIHTLNVESKIPFLDMELYDGQDLARVLAERPLETVVAITHCREIASAMVAAHAPKIAHRDLKPSNIMITNDGRVKVVDFGIAKPLDGFGVPSSTTGAAAWVTSGGRGTRSYASPEQFSRDDVGTSTDSWSLGCVIYESLTGKKAFPNGPIASFDRPSADPIHAGVRRTLWPLLERCWSYEPEARPDARTIRDTLDRLLYPSRQIRIRISIWIGVTLSLAFGFVLWFSPTSSSWEQDGLVLRNLSGFEIARSQDGVAPPTTMLSNTPNAYLSYVLPSKPQLWGRGPFPRTLALRGNYTTDHSWLAILDWRGRTRWTLSAKRIFDSSELADMQWNGCYVFPEIDGRIGLLAPSRSISGPLTVVPFFRIENGGLERRSTYQNRGHLEYFPVLDVDGNTIPEQVCLGWNHRIPNPPELGGETAGRSVFYCLNLEESLRGEAPATLESTPDLADPSSLGDHVKLALSFGLDRFTPQRASRCVTIRPIGDLIRISCEGKSPIMCFEYDIRIRSYDDVQVERVTVCDAYRTWILNEGFTNAEIDRECERLRDTVTILTQSGWQLLPR